MKYPASPIVIGIVVYTMLVLFFNQPISAQIQDQFGQDLQQLLPLTPPKKDTAKLSIDPYSTNTFNNHIELGLSVDPYTSSLAGQESPQLQGIINRLGVNIQGDLPIVDKKLMIKLSYSPQYENYNGAEGKLDEFDAFTDNSFTEVSYRPFSNSPEIALSHNIKRLKRILPVYNNTDRLIGLRFGRIIEYNLRIHRFDDVTELKEDFLLIGSTSHKGTTRLQFGLLNQMVGKMEYSIENAQYQTNLNNLILGISGLEDGEIRSDWRHGGSIKLLQTIAERLVFQEEFNLFLNHSNVDFFNFQSTEIALSTFYKIDTGNWFRIRLSRLWVGFEGRGIRDAEGAIMENAGNRSDKQFSVNTQVNWQFNDYLSFNLDYKYTYNDSNQIDPLYSFLDYQHNIFSATLRGSY
ncbi:hypothetical protein JT359_15500 [Candidatus Poribacteria bacterium]|nr:hypothetical protein [Candidatus Poribacteria bacterium]